MDAELAAHIAQIRDVLPDYGNGFLAAALQVCPESIGSIALFRLRRSVAQSFCVAALQFQVSHVEVASSAAV